MSFLSRTISSDVTKWLHRVNECDFTPAQFIGLVVVLFKSSLKRFRLYLDVTDKEFSKCICDAVCTFYLSKKTYKPIQGPLRQFSTPQGWSIFCEDCWQDELIFHFFTMDYWDNFWEQYEFSFVPDLFRDIQPFLTAVLPLYVRRSTELLVEQRLIAKDGDTYVPWDIEYENNEDEEYGTYHAKTKKQKKLLNDTGS